MRLIPPTMSELEALMPWAHIEVNDDTGEIVIYTGLELDENEKTFWLKGMEAQ